MEKLRELLNEFDQYIEKDGDIRDNIWYSIMRGESMVFTKEIGIQKIISKEYKFIKWLVENNKIDFDFDKIYSKAKIYVFGKNISDTDYFIMLLSIQDNPIEFLISILK